MLIEHVPRPARYACPLSEVCSLIALIALIASPWQKVPNGTLMTH